NGRRPRRRKAPHAAAKVLRRRRRRAVRNLYARHVDVGRSAFACTPQTERRRDSRSDRGQHLSLHRLSTNRRCDSPRERITTLSGSFLKPKTLAETCAILADANQRPILIAGGTDLVVESPLAPPRSTPPEARLVVDVSNLAELLRFEDRGSTIRIGGGVSYLT